MYPIGKAAHQVPLIFGPSGWASNISMVSWEAIAISGAPLYLKIQNLLNHISVTRIIFWIKILPTMPLLISAITIPYLRKNHFLFITVREQRMHHTMLRK